jgi:hypothetical protein
MTTHGHDDDPTPGPYQAAAPTYYRAGWPTFPVTGKAQNIPRGVTGRAGQPIEYATVCDWMVSRPDDNIAIRLTGVIGIDVDAYTKADGVKRGDETLASAEHLWGPLPPTWRSTSREPGNPSGIRFYRVPKGLEFRTIVSLPNADGEVTGDIEIIQHSHRYAVVWPSVHPDTGTTYRWYNPDGQVSLGVPDVLELPVLPDRWVAELTLIRLEVDERPAAPVTAQLAIPADWHPKVTEHYQDGAAAVSGPAGSRHDNTLVVVGQLARDESRGRPGATTALGMLRERFVAAIGTDTTRDPAREFQGMLDSSRTLIATTVSTAEAEREAILAVFANAPEVTGPAIFPSYNSPPPAAQVGPDSDPWGGFGAWAPADIATYLDPAWRPEPPTVLRRTDGRALFYAGNVNWLFGASGEGKTWVALIAVAQEISAGRHVVWIHYEDPLPDKLVHRLVLLGVEPDVIADRFHVVCTSAPLAREGMPFLRAITAHYGAVLVVIDSVGEALGADGIDVKADERFVTWLHATVRVFAGDGQTLIGIDHLPMGEPGRLDPVGSFRKKAATTGSMFLATSPKPPTQERAGVIKLTTAKDRSGLWTKGETAAVVRLGPDGAGGLAVTVEAPRGDAGERHGEPESIVLARHAYRAVKKRGPLSQRALVASLIEVKAGSEAKRRGLDFAVLQGWLVESDGPRGARLYDLGVEAPPSATDLLERWNDES